MAIEFSGVFPCGEFEILKAVDFPRKLVLLRIDFWNRVLKFGFDTVSALVESGADGVYFVEWGQQAIGKRWELSSRIQVTLVMRLVIFVTFCLSVSASCSRESVLTWANAQAKMPRKVRIRKGFFTVKNTEFGSKEGGFWVENNENL